MHLVVTGLLRRRDRTLQPLQLQEIEVELHRPLRRRLALRPHHQLRDQRRQRGVVSRQSRHRIGQVIDPDGITTTYGYTTTGQLASIQRGQLKWLYTYLADGALLAEAADAYSRRERET